MTAELVFKVNHKSNGTHKQRHWSTEWRLLHHSVRPKYVPAADVVTVAARKHVSEQPHAGNHGTGGQLAGHCAGVGHGRN